MVLTDRRTANNLLCIYFVLGDEQMKDEKVIEKLDSILSDRFGFDDKKINKMKEHRFLSSEIGFSAANLFELFLEILNTQFDSYRDVVKVICKKQEEHKWQV